MDSADKLLDIRTWADRQARESMVAAVFKQLASDKRSAADEWLDFCASFEPVPQLRSYRELLDGEYGRKT